MSSKFLDAWGLVIGAAVILNGFFSRSLWNDVEMPMTEERRPDKTPPTKLDRAIYILFGGGLFAYGLVQLLR